MSEQAQPKQSDGKAMAVYLVVWVVFMCVICAPPEQSTLSVLWTLFAGGVIMLEVGWVAVKVLGKIL